MAIIKISEEQEWKNIKGYNGVYKVSNFGNIYSVERKLIVNNQIYKKGGIILKPSITDKGRKRICLYKNYKSRKFFIHRLVAEAFISNPDNKPQINHKDGDPSNNKIDNLEWCTASENIKHSFKTGLHKITKKHIESARKSGINNRVLKKKDVAKIRELKGKIKQVEIARMFNILPVTISEIINNKSYVYN